jgi:hypothetical protein
MVTPYLKNYEIVNRELPIISVEFDPLPDFSDSFQQEKLKRLNYGDLKVEQGRFVIDDGFEKEHLLTFRREFDQTLEFLCLELLKLDTIRYPIRYDIKKWFEKKIKKNNNWYLAPVLDKPGFFMPWHLDNRLMIISGIINLDYNETSTIFQRNDTGWGLDDFVGNPNNIFYTGKKEKNCGTFWLNTELTWHAVPKVQKDRKILLFNAFF